MKAQELRIGNLIEVENCIQEIVELPLPKNCTEKNTKGIKLTQKWIINLGFEWKNHGLRLYNFCIREEINGHVIYLSNESHNFKIDIKHVHELQNLYFALTGLELVYAG
jgi:hypothetical protein